MIRGPQATPHTQSTVPKLIRICALEPSLLEPNANVQFLSGYIPDMCSEAGGPVYTEAEVLVQILVELVSELAGQLS